jgi:hypothetical protein
MATPPRPLALALLFGLAGALVAAVLGLLTFGAQATARPDQLPLAVAVPNEAAGAQISQRLTGQGGDAVSWRVTSPAEAANLLDRKEIYGYLDVSAAPSGAKIVVSGAINPQGTQFAQQILTEVAHRLAQSAGGPAIETTTVHPASVAGRTAPLGASALLWIAGLVATLGFGALVARFRVHAGLLPRFTLAVTNSVLATAVVAGYFRLWDNTLPLTASVLGFLLLTAFAFTAVQGTLVRLFGVPAAAVLGPLYLIAPAVAGQVPELLNPTYRAVLWSWTPFRFSTEGLRSLLLGTPDAPDVRTGVIVLASMATAGLVVLLLTATRKKAQPDAPDGVVPVGVDEADGLPGAQRELPAEHRNGGVRR